MLRPRLTFCAIGVSALMALATLYATPAKAVIIAEASVNGGGFETIATAPNDVGFCSAATSRGSAAASRRPR